MEVPPETLDDLDDSYLFLSTRLLGKQGDCPRCDFSGNPERIRFLRSDTDAVYCGECGRRLAPENVRDAGRREDPVHGD